MIHDDSERAVITICSRLEDTSRKTQEALFHLRKGSERCTFIHRVIHLSSQFLLGKNEKSGAIDEGKNTCCRVPQLNICRFLTKILMKLFRLNYPIYRKNIAENISQVGNVTVMNCLQMCCLNKNIFLLIETTFFFIFLIPVTYSNANISYQLYLTIDNRTPHTHTHTKYINI